MKTVEERTGFALPAEAPGEPAVWRPRGAGWPPPGAGSVPLRGRPDGGTIRP